MNEKLPDELLQEWETLVQKTEMVSDLYFQRQECERDFTKACMSFAMLLNEPIGP